ncbi:MAG: hypothetical protein DRP74_05885 [Candidatus Omnitrophota bacterium]|nr:MAG: hypothetical protein DRP74_05885 [Candidatus Omnitrophota bacterium]
MKNKAVKFKVKIFISLFIIINAAFCPSASLILAQEPGSAIEESEEKISLDLRGVDIIELFKLLSMKTGLTIVPHPGVTGRVSIFLNNVRFEDVLDILLVTYGLAADRRGNIINIMTSSQYYNLYGKKYEEKREIASFKLKYAEPANVFNALSQLKSDIGKIIVDEASATVILLDIPERLELMGEMIRQLDQVLDTEVMSLQYADAKEIEEQVSKLLTTGPGEVAVDERSNKLMVMELPEKMKRIKRMVRAFDEEPSQVLIEASIIEVSLTKKFERGVDWEKILRAVKDLDFVGSFSLGLTSDRQEVSVGTVARDSYTVILQMLEAYGRTSILSEPRIAAVNNKEAKILVGSREAYITSTMTTGETATTTAENIEYVDVGVKLSVTPSVSRDDFVIMTIKPEVSSVRTYLESDLGSRIPIVDTSEAETVVKVKDGAMIMIAGLTKKRDVVAKESTPILGKIPVVNWLFSKETIGEDTAGHTELIIFITPHIISGNVMIPKDEVPLDLTLKKPIKGFKNDD